MAIFHLGLHKIWPFWKQPIWRSRLSPGPPLNNLFCLYSKCLKLGSKLRARFQMFPFHPYSTYLGLLSWNIWLGCVNLCLKTELRKVRNLDVRFSDSHSFREKLTCFKLEPVLLTCLQIWCWTELPYSLRRPVRARETYSFSQQIYFWLHSFVGFFSLFFP